jgi:hypothetical protein
VAGRAGHAARIARLIAQLGDPEARIEALLQLASSVAFRHAGEEAEHQRRGQPPQTRVHPRAATGRTAGGGAPHEARIVSELR